MQGSSALQKPRTSMQAKKGYAQQMAAFNKAIRSGDRPEVAVVDGVRSTIACLRTLDSTTSGELQLIDWRSLAP